jgi:hypothetical protein
VIPLPFGGESLPRNDFFNTFHTPNAFLDFLFLEKKKEERERERIKWEVYGRCVKELLLLCQTPLLANETLFNMEFIFIFCFVRKLLL